MRSWWPHLGAALPGSPLESLALIGLLGTIPAALIHGVCRDRVRQALIMMWSASALLLVAGYHWELQRYNVDDPRPSSGSTRSVSAEAEVTSALAAIS